MASSVNKDSSAQYKTDDFRDNAKLRKARLFKKQNQMIKKDINSTVTKIEEFCQRY